MIFNGERLMSQEELEQYSITITPSDGGAWVAEPFDLKAYKRLAVLQELMDEMILIYRRNRGFK